MSLKLTLFFVVHVHDVGNDKEDLKVFTHRITDGFMQKWHTNINESTKPSTCILQTYQLLLTPEIYLNSDMSYSY